MSSGQHCTHRDDGENFGPYTKNNETKNKVGIE
jgi:hypothetical protein